MLYAINTTRKDFYVLFDQFSSDSPQINPRYLTNIRVLNTSWYSAIIIFRLFFFFLARILRWISDSGCPHLTDEETVCYSTAQGCRQILHRSPACLLNWFRSFVKMHELSFFAVSWTKQSVIAPSNSTRQQTIVMLCILCTINGWFWHFII